MKHISSISTGVVLGSAGLTMMSILTGCENPAEQEPQNKFLVIEKQLNGKYVVVEEMPTDGASRAIIREKDVNGNVTERFMNEAEMKALAEQEYKKVQDGTSETIQENGTDDGLGLGGILLAAGAGALLGNMIGNSLSNNKNFARNSASTNRSSYSRSNRATTSKTKTKRKSFFGSSSSKSRSSSRSRFGG